MITYAVCRLSENAWRSFSLVELRKPETGVYWVKLLKNNKGGIYVGKICEFPAAVLPGSVCVGVGQAWAGGRGLS